MNNNKNNIEKNPQTKINTNEENEEYFDMKNDINLFPDIRTMQNLIKKINKKYEYLFANKKYEIDLYHKFQIKWEIY